MRLPKSQKDANSINLIRLLAALQVFFGHANVHLNTSFLPKVLMEALDVLKGVPVFYILSGFLIWHSIATTADLGTFCKKRVFRLYPELWGGVLVNFVLVAILFFDHIQWIPYMVFQATQSTVLQFWTPGFLRDYGCGVPNGSLGTIFIMLQAYLAMWFLHKWLHGKKLQVWIATLVASIGISFVPMVLKGFLPDILYKLYMQVFVSYFWLFVLGMMLSEFFDQWIGFLTKFWYVFALGAAIPVILSWDIATTYGIIQSCLVAPAIIGFAYRFPKPAIKNDYSYGIYIYHMVAINVLIHFHIDGAWWTELVALVITVALAVASYHTLGALSRKKRNQISKVEA